MATGAYVGESKILDSQAYRITDGLADAVYSFAGIGDTSIFFDGQLFTVVINGVIYTDCLLQLYESGSNFAYISIPNEPTWSIIVRPPSYNLYVPYDALADVFELSMQIYMDSGVARKITGGYIGAYGLTEATNLAIDGSFEDALNNWNCWLAEPTDTSQAKDGSRSLKLGGDALAGSKAAVSLVAGHKYYGREYIKTAGELTAADCRFELCGAVDGVEKSFVFGWNRGNYPDWTAISDVVTADGAYDFGLRTFTVAGSCNAWVDSIVVIDLTATYGAGNEPTKEWCDIHIPYFDGTAMISDPRKPNIARKIKKGYIGDENGVARLFWSEGGKVVLEVEKITSDTYAGETTYTGEQFILLDIYPKTNGTVKVTYGGLTKTITDTSGAESPNAQKVFFGTFNGVTDGVTTPASGELVIKGDYIGFACGSYSTKSSKGETAKYCLCITAVNDMGGVELIPDYAFSDGLGGCEKITSIAIPNGVVSIGRDAFNGCSGLTEVEISASVTSIGNQAFYHANIGTNVFNRTVRLLSTTPAYLGSKAFYMPGANTIIVPAGSGLTYKATAGWSEYADYILEES